MYIKKLELLNFQVIKEFNADFEGNVYFITGDNELGKSTLLKLLMRFYETSEGDIRYGKTNVGEISTKTRKIYLHIKQNASIIK